MLVKNYQENLKEFVLYELGHTAFFTKSTKQNKGSKSTKSNTGKERIKANPRSKLNMDHGFPRSKVWDQKT